MRVIIALGGNALGNDPITQKENAISAARNLIPIIKAGYEVVITHGNGPQVGLINLAFTEGNKVNDKVYFMPFAECGAMSEGYIGYHLQNALVNELRKEGIDLLKKNIKNNFPHIEEVQVFVDGKYAFE